MYEPTPFLERMIADGATPQARAGFVRALGQLGIGSGMLAEADIEPARGLVGIGDVQSTGSPPVQQTVLIKLNGGLGTGMGLQGAKSLLRVRDGAVVPGRHRRPRHPREAHPRATCASC